MLNPFRPLFFVVLFVGISATIEGRPFMGKRMVRTYMPSDYNGGTQNWAVCSDSNQWLYFGNQGILIFDGVRWRNAPTRNGSAVRALTPGNDGKIYYGAINEFGVLNVDHRGNFFVEVLSNDIEFQRADVWSVNTFGENKICFQTETRLFIFDKGSFTTVQPEGELFYLTYKVGNDLLVFDAGVGLKVVRDTALILVASSEKFKDQRIESIMVDSKNVVTLLLRSGGVYRANYRTGANPVLSDIREVTLKTGKTGEKLGLYTGYQLSDTILAIGTTQQGLFLIDTLGGVIYNANMNNQLLSDAVYGLTATHDGVLWLAQDMGIARIEVASDINCWDHTLGLKGTVYKMLYFREKLYAGTSYGLFVTERSQGTGEPQRFKQIDGLRSQTWDLCLFGVESDTLLLAAAGDGFYRIDEVAKKIFDINSCFSFAVCRKPDNPVLVVGHGKGLSFYQSKNKSLVELPIRTDLQSAVRKMAIDNEGNVWVSSPYAGVGCFSLNAVKNLNPVIAVQKYSPDSAESFRLADLVKINDRVMVVINGKIFFPDKENAMLKADKEWNDFLRKHDIVPGITQYDARSNSVWINGEYIIRNFGSPDYVLEKIPVNRFDISFIHQFFILGDYLFLATEKGLYQFNHRRFVPDTPLKKPIVNRIITSVDTLFVLYSSQPFVFKYPTKNITLQFSSSNYLAGEKLRYRIRLHGFEKDYSLLENQWEKTYTNLLPGSYQFGISVVDGYERESEPLFIDFRIESPWYLTIVAIVFYLGLLVLFIIFVVRRRTKRLQRIRKYLQEEIKERTREIARQHQQLKKLSLIVEKTDNAVSVFSVEGRLLWCNNAFTQIYGYTVDEFIQAKCRRIFSTHESPQVRHAYEKCLQTKQTVRYEFFTLNRFEEGIWIQTTLTPILDRNGKIKQIIAVDTDVTNLKNADEEIRYQKEQLERINAELKELSIIAQETDNAVVVSDSEGYILWVNNAYTKIYGYSTEEMVSAKVNILDLTSNNELKNWIKNWPPHKKSIQYDSQNPTKDGNIIWAHTTITPVRDANGNIYRFIGIDSDITKLKQAEEEIAWQKQQLEKLNATKDKFFSIIGHDLRSPFGNFVGITNLLLQNYHFYNSEQLLQFVIKLNRSAQNSYNLLENLLAWARSQRDKVELAIKPNDMVSLIKENIELLAPFAERKKLELVVEIPQTLVAFFDEDTVRLIIRNLLFNALKYTPSGGKITVAANVNENKAMVLVTDTGVGISPENLQKLFKLDIIHSTLGTDNERGTGLGLILCSDFIARNGGEIGVESVEGKGSTFWFSLPLP